MSTDYAEAFQHGIEAAKNAERALAEVRATFDEFSEKVRAASSGRISSVQVRPSGPDKFGRTHRLLAVGPSPEKSVELAEIHINPSGFPVLIAFDRETFSCDDRESIEQALFRLLENPATGRRILALMNDQKDAA